MEKKSAYNYDDLIKCGNGELFGPGNAKLPLPPMLMFDRITEIEENKGAFKKGVLKAAIGAFLGFFVGVFIKFLTSLAFGFIYIRNLWNAKELLF